MRYSCVVFDLDGTLVDSLEDIAHAANEVLVALGFAPHEIPKYRYFVGDGVNTLFRRTLPAERVTDDVVGLCIARFGEVYDRMWNQRTRLYPGVAEMIAELRTRNVALAVLSNKPQRFTEKCVTEFLGDVDFAMVSGQRDGVPKKPDPAGAFEIARTLKRAPSDCLYLGDTSVDMQTACGAGMLPVGALWGFRTRDELVAHGAARLVEHPREVPPIVWGE